MQTNNTPMNEVHDNFLYNNILDNIAAHTGHELYNIIKIAPPVNNIPNFNNIPDNKSTIDAMTIIFNMLLFLLLSLDGFCIMDENDFNSNLETNNPHNDIPTVFANVGNNKCL